jgi:glycosyltransferase involved in cell wall biosynthesis
MIKKPLISVIMPVYNCEKFVAEAVQSILNQSYGFFEFLIIDDCSTDSTLTIIKNFTDERIKIIEKPENFGYTNSLNLGLDIAQGKYVARMDGDDVSLPNRFEKQVRFLELHTNVVICGTQYQILDSDVIVSKPSNFEDIKLAMLEESAIGHPTAMLRLETLKANGIKYNTNREPAEDFDLWVRLCDYGELHNLDEVFFLYRMHDGQVSENKKLIQRELASESRWNMLQKLKISATTKEEIMYKKLFSLQDRSNFADISLFLLFRQKAIRANKKQKYFDTKKFIQFWNDLERKIILQYFIANKNYSPKIIKEYFTIYNQLYYKLSFKFTFKMIVKSLFYLKVS